MARGRMPSPRGLFLSASIGEGKIDLSGVSMSWQYYHTVWLIMGFGWVSLYLVRMGIAPLLGMIMEEFHLSHAAAGSLFSAIFYSYSLMQLPSGYLGDRFGRRKILILGTGLWFVLSLVTSFVQSFAMLVVVRFLTGVAQGTYFGNDRPTIIAFTPKDKMGQGQGVSFMGLALGFFLSVFLAGAIAEHFHDWRWVFVFFSIPSMITSFLVYKYIREPEMLPSSPGAASSGPDYRRAFLNRDLWIMYIIGFLILFAFWMIATWMPSIYREVGVTGIATSSLLSGTLGLTGIPGLFLSGLLSDRIAVSGYGRKAFIALIIFLLALLLLGLGYMLQSGGSSIAITVLFFLSGLIVFGVWAPYYALLSELAPQAIVGTTFGLANLIGFTSAWIAPYLTGWIKDTTGSFSGGLYLSGLLLVAGAILCLGIRPAFRLKGEGAVKTS